MYSINMDTATLDLMSSAEINQSLKSVYLEQAYERALRQSERIYEEERSRALRLQLLVLEDENDVLQEQLVDDEVQLERLEDSRDELQNQQLQTEADLQRTQVDLKSRLRDIEHYKAELNNLSSMSADSTKLLTEKLALAREVATLKPEIEHLRSQTTSHQNLLAEKLALQRELSSLQVELETEKRAFQRTRAKDTKSSEDESRVSGQIEELKKELAKEKRETQKIERETRKQSAEWEGQKTILESKLDAFRNKLRTTKDQLKEVQKELEEAQVAKATRQADTRLSIANPRKRPVARFDPDMTIGTPGIGGHAAKKAKTATLPGDKSTFSITPFLNRTMSMAPDTPSQADQDAAAAEKKADEIISEQIDAIVAETEQCSPTHAKTNATKKSAVHVTAKAKERQVLKDATNPKANAVIQKPRNVLVKPALAKVTEEDANEDEEATENPSSLPDIQKKPQIKKKQKMLGQRKSLFDDDDDEGEHTKSRGLMGIPRGLGLRGGAGVGMISLAAKGKTLAEFSPLKKERRAAVGV